MHLPVRRDWRVMKRATLCALPVISGAAGLIFEILWFKDLAVVFGNTAYAAAAVLSVFFLGLAAGGRYWGERCARTSRPLRLYGFLELGIAGSALLFLALVEVYRQLYEAIFDPLSGAGGVAVRLLLSGAVLFPPAFLMGGTVPALAQRVVRTPAGLGTWASLLYGLNTLGAAGGALLAGFVLPVLLGFRGSYGVAVALSTIAGVTALATDREGLDGQPREHVSHDVATPTPLSGAVLLPIAFLSGFLTLGAEVLWTRLLSQVLNNSTYAFSAILTTFLVAIGLGSLVARAVLRRPTYAMPALMWTLVMSGGAVVLSSLVFVRVTRGLMPLAVGPDWFHYVRSVFAASAALLFVPAVLMGLAFPLLFFLAPAQHRAPGDALGRLLAVNSLGSIAGALCTGFILLDALGYWRSLLVLAGTYLTLGAVVGAAAPRQTMAIRAAGLVTVSLIVILALSGAPPVVNLAAGEQLVSLEEGSGGTVTVVRSGENLVMRLNNSYVLGDTRSSAVEQLQAHLPLLLHPAPTNVFFLGLGTGITAGASLEHPVKRVVAAELLPEVVDAAREHFQPYLNGLFEDPRVRVVADDGRSYLAGNKDQYDVIVSDLFTPWHAGTGSLYTLEHFRIVRERMHVGGIFAQWLPLFQMSRTEFFIIARTMQAVFPQVTVWRGNFSPTEPIVALVAQSQVIPLDQTALTRSAERLPSPVWGKRQDHMVGLFYAGNMMGILSSLAHQPMNTDDRPVIEYLAPRLQAGGNSRFVGVQLEGFLQQLLDSLPPERDPLLAGLPKRERTYVRAGFDFFRYHLYAARGRRDSAAVFLERVRQALATSAP